MNKFKIYFFLLVNLLVFTQIHANTIGTNFPYGASPNGNIGTNGNAGEWKNIFAPPESMLGSWAMQKAVTLDKKNFSSWLQKQNVDYAVGTAAVGGMLNFTGCNKQGQGLLGCNKLNGRCFAIKINDTLAKNRYMIFQSVNTAVGYANSFDVYMPGGGAGAAGSLLCQKFWQTKTVSWGNNIENSSSCNKYFNNYQDVNPMYQPAYIPLNKNTFINNNKTTEMLKNACEYSFSNGYFRNPQGNPNVGDINIIPIQCPISLTQITGIRLSPEIEKTLAGKTVPSLAEIQEPINLNTIKSNVSPTGEYGYNCNVNWQITGNTWKWVHYVSGNVNSCPIMTQMQDCQPPSSSQINNMKPANNFVVNYQAYIMAGMKKAVLSARCNRPSVYCANIANKGKKFCSWNTGETANGTNNCGSQAFCTCNENGSANCKLPGDTSAPQCAPIPQPKNQKCSQITFDTNLHVIQNGNGSKNIETNLSFSSSHPGCSVVNISAKIISSPINIIGANNIYLGSNSYTIQNIPSKQTVNNFNISGNINWSDGSSSLFRATQSIAINPVTPAPPKNKMCNKIIFNTNLTAVQNGKGSTSINTNLGIFSKHKGCTIYNSTANVNAHPLAISNSSIKIGNDSLSIVKLPQKSIMETLDINGNITWNDGSISTFKASKSLTIFPSIAPNPPQPKPSKSNPCDSNATLKPPTSGYCGYDKGYQWHSSDKWCNTNLENCQGNCTGLWYVCVNGIPHASQIPSGKPKACNKTPKPPIKGFCSWDHGASWQPSNSWCNDNKNNCINNCKGSWFNC